MKMLGNRLRAADLRVKPLRKQANAFYLTPEWRAFVERLIVERFGHRSMARCQDKACQQPGRRGIRLYADHMAELQDGGAPYDPSNILFRCGACHTRKTNAEREKRNATGG